MNRIKLYESAIKDLHEVKMEHMKAEITKAKYQLAGLAIFAITSMLAISFLIY